MKEYRFFYHYYKQTGKMSVHFKGVCHIVDNVSCLVPCETKWKSTQPKLVMQGFAKELFITGGKAYIK